ncbi:MAG: ABC transporter ATP-binding protein [Proteobacteria bacterium]|nr:MAG: ABC transporter ATP-binding protein [Pseudomonadota bacterium]
MNLVDRAATQHLLHVERLHVRYDAVTALRDITVTVDNNEAVALIGANGAGKSTLFKSIMGFLKPAAGSISFAGQSLAHLRPERRAHLGLGYCPEGRRVFPGLTVRENLEVAVRGPPGTRGDLVDYAFELFPALAERRDALGWQLSGGQQQMLAIARALMGRPRLLLLDEPSLGLAPKLVDEVLKRVRTIVASGTSVLLAEQNVTKALACCERAYLLEVGSVALAGMAAELQGAWEIKKAYLGG